MVPIRGGSQADAALGAVRQPSRLVERQLGMAEQPVQHEPVVHRELAAGRHLLRDERTEGRGEYSSPSLLRRMSGGSRSARKLSFRLDGPCDERSDQGALGLR